MEMRNRSNHKEHTMELKYRGSEIFKRQSDEYLDSARKMRQHNQKLTKRTRQAERREVEQIPNAVMMARNPTWTCPPMMSGYASAMPL